MESSEQKNNQKLALILQQIESLPALPGILLHLLKVLDHQNTHASEVVSVVQSDAALCGKIMALSQRTARKLNREEVTNIDRAVVLLGFEAIRNAVLSIKILEVFDRASENRTEGKGRSFDHASFWKHNLAVGITAELLAAKFQHMLGVKPADAFVCGLMHDVGKLALDSVLPKSYQRVVEVTDRGKHNIAEIERQLIGIDHHTAGKRLAEHWNLPHMLVNCIWLHGTPYDRLPEVKYREMVGIVTLADIMVRRQFIGYSGNYTMKPSFDQQVEALGLDVESVLEIGLQVHEEIEQRASILQLEKEVGQEEFTSSLMKANMMLGRLNEQLETKSQSAEDQNLVLNAINTFHAESTLPGHGVVDILELIGKSVTEVFGAGCYATLCESREEKQWLLATYDGLDHGSHIKIIDPPMVFNSLDELIRDNPTISELLCILPDLNAAMSDVVDTLKLKLTPLPCGWGSVGYLIHDRDLELGQAEQSVLLRTWGASLAAAAQHDGAKRISERLVETQNKLHETQDALLQNQALAKVGEIAAGAAHEMNNPLMVISGRSQLLAATLENEKDRAAAHQIAEQSLRLSDMITSLRLFADAPKPKNKFHELNKIFEEVMKRLQKKLPDAPAPKVALSDQMPLVFSDLDQFATVIFEVLVNAYESNSETTIEIETYVDPIADRLVITIRDEGVGMDAHTQEHAFDPFYSAKPAGRQPGLGLSRAKRLMDGLKGEISIESIAKAGTTVTLRHPISSEVPESRDAMLNEVTVREESPA